MPDCDDPSPSAYQRHIRERQEPCDGCRRAHSAAATEWKRAKAKGVANPRHADDNAGMWPGITAGLDVWCSCTRATMNGVYQVKVRDTACRNHGGPLAVALARWGAASA